MLPTTKAWEGWLGLLPIESQLNTLSLGSSSNEKREKQPGRLTAGTCPHRVVWFRSFFPFFSWVSCMFHEKKSSRVKRVGSKCRRNETIFGKHHMCLLVGCHLILPHIPGRIKPLYATIVFINCSIPTGLQILWNGKWWQLPPAKIAEFFPGPKNNPPQSYLGCHLRPLIGTKGLPSQQNSNA